MQVLLTTAEDRARFHQVIQRKRAFSGASLFETLVCGYLAKPDASLADLCQTAALCEVQVSRQAIDQRLKGEMGEHLAPWLAELVGLVTQQLVPTGQRSLIPLLRRFPGIWVEDTTVILLPTALADRYPGCGGSAGTSGAALKLALQYDLVTGTQRGPLLAAGRVHDRTLADDYPALPSGSLYLADLGYFSLERFAELAAAQVHILSRLKAGVLLVDAAGKSWDAAALLEAQERERIDVPIRVGKIAQFPCRLLAVRAPEHVVQERRRKLHYEAQREGRTPRAAILALAAWTVAITTLGPEDLTLAEAFALLHARWQIELLWKGWKTEGRLHVSRSANPIHIEAEIYAKLLGLIIQQWLLQAVGYQTLEWSWQLATRAIRGLIRSLAAALWRGRGVQHVIALMAQSIPPSARIAPRSKRPSTAQLLRHPDLVFQS